MTAVAAAIAAPFPTLWTPPPLPRLPAWLRLPAFATAGKAQRNPASHKLQRNPATGKLRRNTATTTTCCCGATTTCAFSPCGGTISGTPQQVAITFDGLLNDGACTDCVSSPIKRSSYLLDGTFVLTCGVLDGFHDAYWNYVEEGDFGGRFFGDDPTCSGVPPEPFDRLVIEMRRYTTTGAHPNEWHVRAYLTWSGSPASAYYTLFYCNVAVVDCAASFSLTNVITACYSSAGGGWMPPAWWGVYGTGGPTSNYNGTADVDFL